MVTTSATVCLLLAAAAAVLAQEEDLLDEEFYKKIFDDVDSDSIIDNDRICDYYLKCFFSEGPCSTVAADIKKGIPEVMSTNCGKCNEDQKKMFWHTLNKFIPKRPKDWEKMLSIYDPKGEYWPAIKADLDAHPNA